MIQIKSVLKCELPAVYTLYGNVLLTQFPYHFGCAFGAEFLLNGRSQLLDVAVGEKQLFAYLLTGLSLTEKLRHLPLVFSQM